VNASLVEHHVLPRYETLAAASAALAEAADGMCSAPAGAGLAGVRQGFHQTMDAWMGVQHLRFGPVELFMRGYRFYFWPEARGRVAGAVDELLAAGDAAALAPERLRETSVAAQGLPAVEYLLYRGTEPRAAPACALLVTITGNLQRMAAEIVAEWRGGGEPFARTVSTPGPDNGYFVTHRDATLAFFKSFHGGLRLIADVKLKPVLGESLERARPRLAESRRSGRALRNIARNLAALQALYLGEGGSGLTQLVREHGGDPELDPLMRKAFRMTLATARGIDAPLGEAVVDPALRPRTEKLHTQVLALKQIVKTRVAAALGLAVGFNALDGD